MKDLLKYYILNIPWSLYGIGLGFLAVLLLILYPVWKDTRRR